MMGVVALNDMEFTQKIPRTKLRTYQNDMISRCVESDYYGVFAEPGAGKTITMGTVIADLNVKALVVSTPRICDCVWQQELAAWEHTAHLTVGNLHTTPAKRKAQLDNQVLLISFELVKWFMEQNVDIDCLVIDESSCIKNTSSKRYKLLRKLGKRVKRRYILSGTPRPNSSLELYPQMAFLCSGEKAPWNLPFTQFRLRYYNPLDKFGWRWRPKKGVDAALTKLVARDAISIRTADCLDLPELNINDVFIELPKKARSLYDEMFDEFVIELSEETVIDAVNGGVKVGKLAQIAAGAIYDEFREWHLLHDEKISVIKELVDDITTPVMIIYRFRHDLERLRQVFPDAVVMDGGTVVDSWNNNEIPILLLQPQAGGHGLNLQKSKCQHQIWFNPTYSCEQYQQTIARLHRSGQRNTVFIHRILAADTIDLTIATILARKVGGQNALLEELKLDIQLRSAPNDVKLRIKQLRAAMQNSHPDRGGNDIDFIVARKAYETFVRDSTK